MTNLLRKLHEQTGKRVVVLVDEYDNFILHALGDKEKMDAARHRFQNVFGPLKAEDDHLQFAFITGISKFSQMGIFSKLNNLKNISMQNAYETLCGISEEELTTLLRPDIEQLAAANDLSYDDQLQELKHMYDGYHFSRKQTDMYNPFSLVNALDSQEVGAYWFDRGTSSALFEMLAKMPQLDMAALEGRNCTPSAFDLPLESFDDPLPVLYQSGYLTMKSYRRDRDIYTLGFPNQEVRKGFAECLYRHVTNSRGDSQQQGELLEAYYDFRDSDDLPAFIEAIKTFFAGVPYHWQQDNRNEHCYHALLYTLLAAFGADVRDDEPSAKGRSDLTLLMPKGIYVMELKYDDTVDAALEQIDRRGYAEKYKLDGRPITKVGIAFSSTERNITDWKTKL